MKYPSRFLAVVILLCTATFSFPSLAQDAEDGDETNSRIEKLEKDLNMLQRQVARGSRSSGGAVSGNGAASADFEVRLSAAEDQMRKLMGRTEENEFKIKKLTENLDKLQRDTDFRFNDLAKTQAAAASAAQPAVTQDTKQGAKDNKDLKKDKHAEKTDVADESEKTADSEVKSIDDSAALKTDFASARDHYNYAFRLLNQTQYDKAAISFEAFTKKYPKDPLVGNAYYWLGETFYIRRDYVGAADNFRQGFEAVPSGSKAPDNLLKLAMSLNALKRDKEACVVLGQVVAKFNKSASAVAQKAESERKRIACE